MICVFDIFKTYTRAVYSALVFIYTKLKSMPKSIFKLESTIPGPTVAIFAGVHGNELAGIQTVDYLLKNIKLTSGTVYLVYANPRAIQEKVRFVEKNLNRCFRESAKSGDLYEEKRAVELMNILDSCDALLDLHAYNEPHGEATPFAISEPNANEIVSTFDLAFVVKGVDKIEKGGSDGYMSNQGKVGICVELGAISKPEKYVNLGIQTAYQFLQYFDMVEKKYEPSNIKQAVLQVDDMYVRQNKDFTFAKDFRTFDRVERGQLICTDGEHEIYADAAVHLLFPGSNNPIGVEAYMTAISCA